MWLVVIQRSITAEYYTVSLNMVKTIPAVDFCVSSPDEITQAYVVADALVLAIRTLVKLGLS